MEKKLRKDFEFYIKAPKTAEKIPFQQHSTSMEGRMKNLKKIAK
jgi:hypothetical protein